MSQSLFTTSPQPPTLLPYSDPVSRVLCNFTNNFCDSSYQQDTGILNTKGDDLENYEASFPTPEVSETNLNLLGVIGGFILILVFLAVYEIYNLTLSNK